MHFRLCLESKPPSRLREAPLRSTPTSFATCFNTCRPSGNSTISVSLTGATGTGAKAAPEKFESKRFCSAKPTLSPLTIPLVYCHINSFQPASSVEKPLPGGENRREGRASPHEEW